MTLKNIPLKTLLFLLIIFNSPLSAQMSGSYAVPGSFTSLAAAISSLNSVGVSGPCTINILAGYTETVTGNGFTLTATGTATSPIVFQKSGAGANPLITAYTGGTATPTSAIQDGIWRLVGCDYVTIDGIDLLDPNTTNPATMEFGYGLFKASAIDGCQNNLIQNCVITLNRINDASGLGSASAGSRGIDMVDALPNLHAAVVTVSASSGSNSYNKFYSNTIQNCMHGISLAGFNAPSPYLYVDSNNDVGGNSSTTGNNIINFGGGGPPNSSAGIYSFYQYELNISNNLIDNNNGAGVNHGWALRGIYINSAPKANVSILQNTVSVKSGSGNGLLYAIENQSGSTAGGNTINISNNLIANCSYTGATNAVFRGISNSGAPSILSVNNNTFLNNSTAATSTSFTSIFNNGQVTNNINLNNNLINIGEFNANSTSLVVFGIQNASGLGTTTLSVSGNTLQNANFNGSIGGTGAIYLLRHDVNVSSVTMSSNKFNNLSIKTSGGIVLLYDDSDAPISTISNNFISGGLIRTVSGGQFLGYTSSNISTGTSIFTGNNFSDITLTGSGSISLSNQNLTSTRQFLSSNNTFTNINAPGCTFYGIKQTLGASGSSVTDNLFNNINVSTFYSAIAPGGVQGTLTVSGNTVSAVTSTANSYTEVFDLNGQTIHVTNNLIGNILNAGPTSTIIGMFVYPNVESTISNNIIGDLQLSNSNSTKGLTGISVAAGTLNLLHNTLYMAANSSGTDFGSRGLYINSNYPYLLQNNIFINNSIANGTGKTILIHTINSNLNSYHAASNNNIFYVGASPSNSYCMMFDETNTYNSLTNFQNLLYPREINSYYENTSFSSTSGSAPNFLRISNSPPSVAESNGLPISGINNDFENDIRFGHPGYAGTGQAPDIGADEYNGTFIDIMGPIITHTALVTTCSTGDRTLTATISDPSGVPLTGSLSPTVYYQKNSGSFLSSPGILASGTASNGVWNFTISSASLSGLSINDVITYFIIAQDNQTIPNVSSNPASGLIATGINSISSFPTSPHIYTVTSLSGTYTVGSGGAFTTLSSAANAYNTSCLNGPVTFVLTDILYSGAENFPITFTNNFYASITNSLLIVPASGVTAVITPTTTNQVSVLKFSDARYIHVDGLNSGASAISVVNTNTITASSAVWLASKITGCNNLTLSNLEISGLTNTLSNNYGLLSSKDNTVFSNAGGADNDFINLIGLNLSRCTYGIAAYGSALSTSSVVDNWTVKKCQIGPSITNSLTNIGLHGMLFQNAQSMAISENTVCNVSGSAGGLVYCGISFSTGVTSSTLNANHIHSIRSNATAGGSGIGLNIETGTYSSDLLIQNNMISNIGGNSGNNFTVSALSAVRVGGSAPVGGIKFYNNSIALTQSNTVNGIGGGSLSACMFFATNTGSIELLNNLLYSNLQYTTSVARTYLIYSQVSNLFTAMDYNNYYVDSPQGVMGYLNTTTVNTLASFQNTFGLNLNSKNILPVFTSSVDIHLPPLSNGLFDNLGSPLPTVTGDIDLQSRSLITPDIGADEFTTPNCSTVSAVTITNPSFSICVGQSVTINRTDYLYQPGISQDWQISNSSSGPYTVIASASGTSYGTPTLSPGTYYYVVANTCSFSSQTALSNQATVTVYPYPVVSVTPSSITICQAYPTQLVASGAQNYTWTPSTFLSSNNGATVIASPTLNTTYFVSASNGSCTGTSNTASVVIKVTPAGSTLNVSATPTLVCQGGSVNLQAVATTTNYSVSPISYAPISTPTSGANVYQYCNNGTVINWIDMNGNLNDGGWDNQGLPFNFTMFGQTYATYGLSTNGFLLLGSPFSPQFNGYGNAFPSSSAANPAIGACYGNLDFTNGGFIYAATSGTSPNRRYVINWINGKFYNGSTGTGTVTTQMILFETSNIIEVHTTICSGNSPAVEGIQNNGGTQAVVVPGRNAQTYTVTNDAFRWHFPLTYSWTPSTFLSSTTTSVTTAQNVQSNTIYTIEATSGNSCSLRKTVTITTVPAPTIAVSANTTAICAGGSISFTASGANTYTWSGGPQTSTYAASPATTATFVVSGTGTLNTCVTTASQAITVHPNPIISILGNTLICVNQAATLAATGADTYSWSTGPTTESISVTSTSAGTNTFSVIGTTTLGGCTSSTNGTIIAYTNPTLTVSGNSIVCSGKTATITASGASTYSWNTGNITPTIFTTPLTNSVYILTGYATPANCTAQAQFSVNVLSTPTIVITGSNNVCQGNTATLTASGATTYSWNIGGSGAVVTFTPASTTNYIVTGTNSANGCAASASALINVISRPNVNIASPGASVCPGMPITFTASGGFLYSWSAPGGNSSILTVTPAAPSSYTVTGSNSFGCSSTKSVTVGLFPTPLISTSANQTICAGEVVTFTASGANTYLWLPPNVSGSTFTVAPSIPETFTVTGTDINNCRDTKLVQLYINECVGLQAYKTESQMVLYPNPNSGIIYFESISEGIKQLEIFNAAGQLVKSVSIAGGKTIIDISGYAKGMYVVKIQFDNAVSYRKLLLQ